MTSRQPGKQLKKQPRMRRVRSATAVSMPQVSMPPTAKRRRRRNSRLRLQAPLAMLKNILFTARWISLGLLVLTIYALYAIGMNEAFYLTTIPVEGNVTIPANEIAQASGLAGIHVFAANPHDAAAKIAAVPGIISAEVTLSWPNQVHISVQEDSPIAVWRQNGQSYWVSEQGSLIPARTGAIGLLTIEAVNIPAAQTNVMTTSVAGETAVTGSVPTFIPKDVLTGALLLRQLRPEINQLYYDPSGGLYYQDGRGWLAYFGTGTDMAQKLVVYEQIAADLISRGITPSYISVSNQKNPYYKAGQS